MRVGQVDRGEPDLGAASGELVGLIQDNTISGRIAKKVFVEMYESGKVNPAMLNGRLKAKLGA